MKLDHDRIRARLQDISKSLIRLRRFQEVSKEDFLSDEDSQDIARSRLLTAIEAALNICYHISAKELKKVPEDYAECFQFLGDEHLIDPDLAVRLSQMARFRNRLVHLYWDIDYGQVYEIIKNDIDDLEEFSNQVVRLL
ncbi:MAG: DUF86 domain-containing protein [Deltaproteobacteria bacterium]|nr:DUF86 domain-containing protein [Deltaproteobacteria bacterium]